MNRTQSLFSLTLLGALAAAGCESTSTTADAAVDALAQDVVTPDVARADAPPSTDVVASDRPDAASPRPTWSTRAPPTWPRRATS
ncbi:MAG: hypothetical protein U0325_24410 [Polyangiales bacterium]